MVDEAYKSLQDVLEGALHQASSGKGKERHATPDKFEDQPTPRLVQHFGYESALLQACKKLMETPRILELKGVGPAIREMHGAICYIGMAIIALEKECKPAERGVDL